jgi:hypothetical protein
MRSSADTGPTDAVISENCEMSQCFWKTGVKLVKITVRRGRVSGVRTYRFA